MADTAKAGTVKRYKVILLQGRHAETDDYGIETLYGPNDVFMASKPLYRRWGNKFQKAEESTPLSSGGVVVSGPEPDPWGEREESANQSGARMASPQEVVPAQHPPFQAGPQGTTPQRVRGIPQKRFEDMTVNELKSYAEEEEIPLQGATKKEDMIKVIRQAEDDD